MSQLSKRDMLETILLYYLFLKVKMARRVTKVVRHIHAPAKAFQTSDLTGASIADLGTKDHDLLTGLGDDDHTQYVPTDGVARQLADAGYPNALLLDGSRTMTSNIEWSDVGSNGMLLKGKRAAANDTALFETQSGAVWWLLKSHDYSTYRSFGCENLLANNIVYALRYMPSTISHGYMRTNAATTYHFYLQSYDTAYRTCIDLVNGRADLPRAGDITMQAQRMMQFGTYTDAQRPAAGTAGRWIFNTDDGMPNYDDGTDWRDINGNIT